MNNLTKINNLKKINNNFNSFTKKNKKYLISHYSLLYFN